MYLEWNVIGMKCNWNAIVIGKYVNSPRHNAIYHNFHCKNDNIQIKNCDIFLLILPKT